MSDVSFPLIEELDLRIYNFVKVNPNDDLATENIRIKKLVIQKLRKFQNDLIILENKLLSKKLNDEALIVRLILEDEFKEVFGVVDSQDKEVKK